LSSKARFSVAGARPVIFCSLVALGCFYAFTLVYLPIMSRDFIERGRIEILTRESPYKPGEAITSSERAHFIRGWSAPEPTGIWSIGRHATVALNLGQRPVRDLRLKVTAFAFVLDESQQQVANVSANGRAIAKWHYAFAEGAVVNMARIAKELIEDDGIVRIDFEFCCPGRPTTKDTRMLAMHLLDFRVLIDPS
jgi:hypothetical protein